MAQTEKTQQQLTQLKDLSHQLLSLENSEHDTSSFDRQKLEQIKTLYAILEKENICDALLGAQQSPQNDSYNLPVTLPFCPRKVQLTVAGDPQKEIELDSDIVPIYQLDFQQYPLSTPSKVELRFLGSPYDEKQVHTVSITELYTMFSLNQAFNLSIQISWDHGNKYIHDTSKVKDCTNLSREYYGSLKDGLSEFDQQLFSFYTRGERYFDHIAYAYNEALEVFKMATKAQTDYETNINNIYNSVLSVVWIGGFSWVAGITKMADVIEDMGAVAIDKVISLQNSDQIKDASNKFGEIQNKLYHGEAIKNGSFSITSIGDTISTVNQQLVKIYSAINEAVRDVNEYCSDRSLNKHKETYHQLADITSQFLNKEIILLTENQSYLKEIDKDKLKEEIERTMWAHWITGLSTAKKDTGPSGMGPYAGRTPNYPRPGYENVNPNVNYKTDLCKEVITRIEVLGIAKLSVTWGGWGSVPTHQIANLIAWANKHLTNPSFSL